MASKKSAENIDAPLESIVVKLRPILGIPPRKYIPAAWGFFTLLLVFLLLLLPGIRKNGSYITIRSLPANASVLVDGIRLGASDEELFVEKGLRKFTVRRSGFDDLSLSVDVKGRIFASALFPRREELEVKLQADKNQSFLSDAVVNAALWAATGPERDRYALPPVLSSAARDILAADASDGSGSLDASNGSGITADRLWNAAAPISADERHLADLLRARMLLDTGGAIPNPGNITALLSSLDASLSSGPSLGELALMLDEKRIAQLGWESLQSEGIGVWQDLIASADSSYREYRTRSSSFLVGGQAFITLPSMSLPIGDLEAVAAGYKPRSGATPALAAVDSFSIGISEISNAQFQQFIRANPRWASGQKKNLAAEGLADSGYLSSWIGDSYALGTDDFPVRDVSWYAAEAYCRWFSRTQLASRGLSARLPQEDEWEIAARLDSPGIDPASLETAVLQPVNRADEGLLGIRGINGNLREWCRTPFRLAENHYRTSDGSARYQMPDDTLAVPGRVVRGSSFIDTNLQYPEAIRGGLQPQTTSPVVGFRMVIVPAGR